MKYLFAGLSGLIFAAASAAPAYAQCGFVGCNVVDDGDFSSLQPGDVLFIDQTFEPNIRVTVNQIDWSSQMAHVTIDADGRDGWIEAKHLYTHERVEERDNATWAVGIGMLLLALSSGSGDYETAAPTTTDTGAGGLSAAEIQSIFGGGVGSSSSSSSVSDAPDGCFWGSKKYGTCH